VLILKTGPLTSQPPKGEKIMSTIIDTAKEGNEKTADPLKQLQPPRQHEASAEGAYNSEAALTPTDARLADDTTYALRETDAHFEEIER
jgi:hypothetical protein